jgi:glycosyltransferase involved in cell wall biosynthesis
LSTVISLKGEDARYIPAYFIQDYEAYFAPPDSEISNEAMRSYELAKEHDALCFAKTKWLVDTLREKHGLRVHLITPSLDHDQYAPGHCSAGNTINVAAMVRTTTPRRSPLMTLKVLAKLKQEYKTSVHITIFGSIKAEVHKLQKIKTLSKVQAYDVNKELLSSNQVATLFRHTDVFVDLSSYQAFGRSAVECMASRCIPVVPKVGGAAELVAGGAGISVDTSDFEDIMRSLRNLLNESIINRRIMKLRAAIKTSSMTSRGAAHRLVEIVLSRMFGAEGNQM